jgi:hypothetical protein
MTTTTTETTHRPEPFPVTHGDVKAALRQARRLARRRCPHMADESEAAALVGLAEAAARKFRVTRQCIGQRLDRRATA